MNWNWALGGLIAFAACAKTEECERLEALLRDRREVLRVAEMRASLSERLEKKAKTAEAEAKRQLIELGFERPVEDLEQALEERTESLSGAHVRAGVEPAPESDPKGQASKYQSWVVDFRARSWGTALEVVRALEAAPPLFRFVGLRPRSSRSYELELGTIRVPRVPLDDVEGQPLPPRPSIAQVPSQVGFCGAETLRQQAANLDAEIDALSERASSTTRYLPLSASWDGVSRRAQLTQAAELRARKARDQLVDAAVDARLRIRAVGAEGNAVILEVDGGDQDQGSLERRLPSEILRSVRFEEDAGRHILRAVVVDSRALPARRP